MKTITLQIYIFKNGVRATLDYIIRVQWEIWRSLAGGGEIDFEAFRFWIQQVFIYIYV